MTAYTIREATAPALEGDPSFCRGFSRVLKDAFESFRDEQAGFGVKPSHPRAPSPDAPPAATPADDHERKGHRRFRWGRRAKQDVTT